MNINKSYWDNFRRKKFKKIIWIIIFAKKKLKIKKIWFVYKNNSINLNRLFENWILSKLLLFINYYYFNLIANRYINLGEKEILNFNFKYLLVSEILIKFFYLYLHLFILNLHYFLYWIFLLNFILKIIKIQMLLIIFILL